MENWRYFPPCAQPANYQHSGPFIEVQKDSECLFQSLFESNAFGFLDLKKKKNGACNDFLLYRAVALKTKATKQETNSRRVSDVTAHVSHLVTAASNRGFMIEKYNVLIYCVCCTNRFLKAHFSQIMTFSLPTTEGQ